MTGLILGVNLQGFGQRPASWRTQDVQGTDLLGAAFWQELGRIAERGTLDMLFFADHPALGNPNVRPLGLLEPFTALQAIAQATSHVGLVGTASTTYNDPVELAERLLSLDLVTGGRLAWNAVTTYSPDVSGNFGLTANPPRPERYARANEFVDVVRALWSGERVEHHGRFFDVEGMLAVPRSAQGEPVVFQAGGSPDGRALAGRIAEGVFSVELALPEAVANAEAVRDAAVAAGRDRSDVRIVPGLSLVLGSTEREAQERYDALEALAPDGFALQSLASYLGDEILTLPADQPVPAELLDREVDPATFTRSLGYRQTVLTWARRNNTTLRDLVRNFGGYGARIIVGTPEQAADSIEEWYRAGAADGFNLMIDEFPRGLSTVVDHLVPLLRDRGIFHHDYEDTTLRGRFRARAAASAAR